jgi:hypothetical protein
VTCTLTMRLSGVGAKRSHRKNRIFQKRAEVHPLCLACLCKDVYTSHCIVYTPGNKGIAGKRFAYIKIKHPKIICRFDFIISLYIHNLINITNTAGQR